MPRHRLCLGFYVCDLEFGICPTLCLFIYFREIQAREFSVCWLCVNWYRSRYGKFAHTNGGAKGGRDRFASPPHTTYPNCVSSRGSCGGCTVCTILSTMPSWQLVGTTIGMCPHARIVAPAEDCDSAGKVKRHHTRGAQYGRNTRQARGGTLGPGGRHARTSRGSDLDYSGSRTVNRL